jgi:hypothetical protein
VNRTPVAAAAVAGATADGYTLQSLFHPSTVISPLQNGAIGISTKNETKKVET